MASTTKIDGAKLMKALVAGFKTEATKRGGKSGFVLVKDKTSKRTLAMASLRADGAVKLEGQRLSSTLRLESAADVAKAIKQLDAIAKENAGKTAITKARVEAIKAKQATGVKVVAPSGKRARSRSKRADVLA